MITLIIAIIIGIACLLIARQVREPIIRILLYCIGAAALIIGAFTLFSMLLTSSDTTELDTVSMGPVCAKK